MVSKVYLEESIKSVFLHKNYSRYVGSQKNIIYISNHKSDVDVYFAPQILYRRKSFQIIGGVGYFVREFEQIWREVINARGLSREDTLLFVTLITNFNEFLAPPFWSTPHDGGSEVDRWICKIENFIDNMNPPTLSELLRITIDAIAGFGELKFSIGHPIKIRAFIFWCYKKGVIESPIELADLSAQGQAPYTHILADFMSALT